MLREKLIIDAIKFKFNFSSNYDDSFSFFFFSFYSQQFLLRCIFSRNGYSKWLSSVNGIIRREGRTVKVNIIATDRETCRGGVEKETRSNLGRTSLSKQLDFDSIRYGVQALLKSTFTPKKIDITTNSKHRTNRLAFENFTTLRARSYPPR